MITVEEFIQKLNSIRENCDLISNAFFSKAQLENLLNNNKNEVLAEDGLLVLITDEPTLKRVSFYSNGEKPLKQLGKLTSHYDKPVVADIVGRSQLVKMQTDILNNAGFKLYSTFVRLSVKMAVPLEYDRFIKVLPAEPKDAMLIYRMLLEEFDPLFAHIPSADEVKGAIGKHEISVVYDGNQVAGFAFFERASKKTKCLRYYLVKQEYRGKGYGAALLMNEFERNADTVSYYLWIGTYNKTIHLYHRLGFAEDGLVDNIMLNKEGT